VIGIKVKNEPTIKYLQKVVTKQIRFATAKALTDTAIDAQKEVLRQLPRRINQPSNFTLRGVATRRATVQTFQALVFIRQIQAEYLQYAFIGGTRRPKGKADLMPVPGNIRLNKYGNIPAKKGGKYIERRTAKNRRYFLGAPYKKGGQFGQYGLWERIEKNNHLKLIIAGRQGPTHYKRRLNFDAIVAREVQRQFPGRFNRAFAKAIATARG